jgi:hypothetical protein
LLEVMIAVFVLATVVGGLVSMVQANLQRLAEVRREIAAAELARERALAIFQRGLAGELPEPGTQEGRFPEPDDDLLWEQVVEPVALPLPPDSNTSPAPSVLFERPGSTARGLPSLYRVAVRAFPEEVDPESVDPFVVFVVKRFENPASGVTP